MKNALREEETIEQLMNQLEKVQEELEKKESQLSQLEQQNFIVNDRISKKDRESQYKVSIKKVSLDQRILKYAYSCDVASICFVSCSS